MVQAKCTDLEHKTVHLAWTRLYVWKTMHVYVSHSVEITVWKNENFTVTEKKS